MNYEDVGLLPYALQHDVGFSGDKLYRAVRVSDSGGFTLVGRQRYSRKEALADIRAISESGGSNRGRRKRNCGPDGVERDKWIPAHAVRFNKDGSVSMLR
jgi:hypothetical protein